MDVMTPELWLVLIVGMVPGIAAIVTVILSNVFAWNEREARVDNLTADTANTNTETIALQQELINNLRARLDNLEAEIGDERELRRRDGQRFDDKIAQIKQQHAEEIGNIRSRYEYKLKALELRVKELEDELARAERDRINVMKERDAARQENHGLLEENYKLRQQIAGEE